MVTVCQTFRIQMRRQFIWLLIRIQIVCMWHYSRGVWLVLCVTASVYGNECTPTPYTGDTSFYPRKPLTYADLEHLIASGSGGKSPILYEVYNLQELSFPPLLQRVKIYWYKSPNGTYMNDGVGWWPNPPPTVDQCQYFTIALQVADRRSKDVTLAFDIIFPTANRYVGTMYSSCPDRYIISWFCPEAALDMRKKFCKAAARLSILTFEESLDNIPWHLISGDICKNRSPLMDDPRWKFTRKGDSSRSNCIKKGVDGYRNPTGS